MHYRGLPAEDATRASRVRFLIAGAGWSAGFLILLRLPSVQQALVAPLTAWQARLAADARGGLPIVVDLSCSGTDVVAICMAALLAYPVAWRRRLLGLAAATIWILSLNALRIASLVRWSGSALFVPLHLYVWPAVLIIAAAAFVLAWMWVVDPVPSPPLHAMYGGRRALLLVLPVLVLAYAAATPSLLQAAVAQQVAIRIASTAAAILRAFGAQAVVGGSTLVVSHASFVVTSECVFTPLMPIYLALAILLPSNNRWRLIATAAFVPIFLALGLLRLLTLAIPPVIMGSPLFLTHAFYQMLVGVLMLAVAASWGSSQTVSRRFVMAAVAALAVGVVLARPYTALITAAAGTMRLVAPHTALPILSAGDRQGAAAILPGYELALLVGLWLAAFGPRALGRFAGAATATAAAQVATLMALGELAAHGDVQTPTVFVRAAAILTPTAIVALSGPWRRPAASSRAVPMINDRRVTAQGGT